MKLKINKINLDLFRDFLEKLVKFDQNLFIKIGPDKVKSVIYFEIRDAIKYLELNTADLFEFDKPLKEEIKVAFYNPKEIITALSFFKSDDIQGEIDYSTDPGGNYATKFVIKNTLEKFDLFCLDKGLSFVDMTEDELENVFITTDLNSLDAGGKRKFHETCIASVYLDNDTIKKIESRLRIGKNEKNFSFKIIDKKLFVVTNNNTLQISDNPTIYSSDIDEVVVYKKYLSLLDKENYNVFLCSHKLVFESLVTDTKMTISALPEDERDLEDYQDELDNLDSLDDLAF